jgi:pilus assembly protein Flp/PilA
MDMWGHYEHGHIRTPPKQPVTRRNLGSENRPVFPWLLSNSFNAVAMPGCDGSSLRITRSNPMTKLFARFLQDQSGATAIEYGLIAAGIALAIIAVVNGLGSNLNTKFTSINSSLK